MLSLQQLKNLKSKENPDQNKSIIEVMPSIVGYILILSSVYGILKIQILFKSLFKIPIFQYLEVSELVLFAPSSTLWFAAYYILLYLSVLVITNNKLKSRVKNFFIISVLLIATSFMFFGLDVEPTIQTNRQYIVVLLLSYVPFLVSGSYIFYLKFGEKRDVIKLSKNFIIFIPLILVIWKAGCDSFYEHYVITETSNYQIMRLKMKEGKPCVSTSMFKYVSRTKNYWFFYDTVNKTIRVIDNSNVEAAEFNVLSIHPQYNIKVTIELDTLTGERKVLERDTIKLN